MGASSEPFLKNIIDLEKEGCKKIIYSEKATKFCKISTNYLTESMYIGQIIGWNFVKFCGPLRIYEL